MSSWSFYEEDTLRAFMYKTDQEIAEYLCLKGYKRNKKQIAGKRIRMGLRKNTPKKQTEKQAEK